MAETPGVIKSSFWAWTAGPYAMFGMYSIAGWLFWWPQPESARRASPVVSARLRTNHLHFHGTGAVEESQNPLLIPLRPRFRHIEPKSDVGQIAIQDRSVQIRESARDEKRGERHGSTEQHSAFEGQRDERWKR